MRTIKQITLALLLTVFTFNSYGFNTELLERDYDGALLFMLPIGIENLSDEEKASVLSNVPIVELAEHRRIALFLAEKGKVEHVMADMRNGEVFTNMDMEKYLDCDEIIELSTFSKAFTATTVCNSWSPAGVADICICVLCLCGKGCPKQKRTCCISASSYCWTEYRTLDTSPSCFYW